jgi:low affinity Fe/Cu permease
VVIIWAATGPIYHYSDTWQPVIDSSSSVVIFLMVFLIQSTQNRDAQTMRMKLNELIRVSTARNIMVDLENAQTGKQGDQSGVQEYGREFPQKRIDQELNGRSRSFNSGRSS